MKKEVCDIGGIFEEAFNKKEGLMTEKNIKFNIKGNTSVVKCNKNAFTRAIDNLVNNAIVHSEEGKNIEVVLEKREIIIKNSYKDTISCTAKQLLEPFVKGNDSRGNSGTGLGLSIAKTIMDMHKFKMKISIDDNVFEVRITF